MIAEDAGSFLETQEALDHDTVGARLAWMGRARQIAEVASGVEPLALTVYFGRLAQTLL